MKAILKKNISQSFSLRLAAFLSFVLLGSCNTNGHSRNEDAANASFEKQPYSFSIEEGRVVLLYKLQKEIARSISDTALVKSFLVDSIYNPNERLFSYCLGYTRESFGEKYTTAMLSRSDEIIEMASAYEMMNLDSIIIQTTEEVAQESVIPFEGRYTIGFFEDAGCIMCGCDNTTMLGNTYHEIYSNPEKLRVVLAHEINHNFYETARQDDPDTSTVLYKAIDEGFANLFSMKVMDVDRLMAFNMLEEEYQWLQDHETELKVAFRKIMFSTDEEDWNPYSERIADRILAGSPGDIGYYIGFRIIENWLSANQDRTWQDVYHTPVREILEESEYFD